jgi:hypothetical protein
MRRFIERAAYQAAAQQQECEVRHARDQAHDAEMHARDHQHARVR